MQIQEEEQEQEMKHEAQVWNHMSGIVDSVVLKCAIELNLFDTINNTTNNESITLSSLTTSLSLPSIKPHYLYRLLRYLAHMKLITIHVTQQNETFSLTELAKLLVKDEEKNLVDWAMIIIEVNSINGWHQLSDYCSCSSDEPTPFEKSHEGKSVWKIAGENSKMNQLINDAMDCDTKMFMPAFMQCCDKFLNGVTSMVDVGGGVGVAMSFIVKAFTRIKCTVFDLPHVIAAATEFPGVEFVEGDMFQSIPPTDAVFLKFMLHNWQDEECVKILKNCKEAIPKNKGKVIIIDIIIDEDEDDYHLSRAKMNLDIDMMVNSGGRERTKKEWELLLDLAGFSGHEIVPIMAIQSVIVAYP